MANVPKRRVVVVHPSVSETLIDGPAASGTVHGETLNMFCKNTGTGFEPWVMNFNP